MGKKDLKGKRILLTGATGGFGREFAIQLQELGAHLILSGRDKSKLDSIANQLGPPDEGGGIIGLITANLSDRKGCEELYDRCLEMTPEIDILINNAGIMAYGDFHEVPQDKWEQLMEINLLSTMRLTYLFLPSMLKRRQGHIVLMSSVAGFAGSRQSSAYSASKFGMRGFGLSLYGEVHKKGIDVTILHPFWADTPILQSDDYGTIPTKKVIGIVVDKADAVIRESIKGIRKRKLSVYPGPTAKVLSFLNRFVQIIGSQGKG
jgi:short-subunit dehydrogenase